MKRFLLFLLYSLLFASLFFYLVHRDSKSETHTEETSMIFNKSRKYGMGIGTAKDKFARFTFQRNKLIDPTTGRIPSQIREKEVAYAKTLPKRIHKNSLDDFDWKERGPYNVGGRTRALAVDISNENLIIAGSVSGGIWKSIDGGQNWYKIPLTDQNLSVTCITQDIRPGHHNEWYYGTGELYGSSQSSTGAFYLGNGMYKSSDYGETWESIISTSNNTPNFFDSFWEGMWDIVVDPENMDSTVIYAATYQSIYRSVDGGQNWGVALNSAQGGGLSYFTELAITSDGVVYAGLSNDENSPTENGGVWRSEDGFTWTQITALDFPATHGRIALGVNPSDNNELYILASEVEPAKGKMCLGWLADTTYHALWRYNYLSGDGSAAGGLWTELTENIPVGPDTFDDFNAQGGYNLMVAVSPENSDLVLIGGTNLYRSTDGFTTSDNTSFIGGYEIGTNLPRVRSYPNHHSDQHGVWFSPSSPTQMLSWNDGGVQRTLDIYADEVEWVSLNNGYVSTQFHFMTIDFSDTNNVLMGGLQDNGTRYVQSEATDASWTHPWGGDGSFSAIPDHGEFIVTSLQSGRIYLVQLDDNGEQVAYERIDPAVERDQFKFIHPFTLDPNDNNTLYLPVGNKLYVNEKLDEYVFASNFDSTNVNWEIHTNEIPVSGLDYSAIKACHTPETRLYLGTDNKRVYRIDSAKNLSADLIDITDSTFPNGGYVAHISVNPENGDEVYLTFSNYGIYSLWHSLDAGTTWTKAAGNLEVSSGGVGPGPSIRWTSILPYEGKTHYFVGTSVGLFYTDTLMGLNTVFEQMAPEMIGYNIVDIVESRTLDGYVAAATHGNGVFTANTPNDAPIMSSVEEVNIEMEDIRLYPNPASESIAVEFVLKNSESIQYQILDELGRITALHHISNYPAGNQKIEIDISSLNSGLYYLSLSSETRKESKSFIIQ